MRWAHNIPNFDPHLVEISIPRQDPMLLALTGIVAYRLNGPDDDRFKVEYRLNWKDIIARTDRRTIEEAIEDAIERMEFLVVDAIKTEAKNA